MWTTAYMLLFGSAANSIAAISDYYRRLRAA